MTGTIAEPSEIDRALVIVASAFIGTAITAAIMRTGSDVGSVVRDQARFRPGFQGPTPGCLT